MYTSNVLLDYMLNISSKEKIMVSHYTTEAHISPFSVIIIVLQPHPLQVSHFLIHVNIINDICSLCIAKIIDKQLCESIMLSTCKWLLQ